MKKKIRNKFGKISEYFEKNKFRIFFFFLIFQEKLVKTKGTQARGMKGKIVNFSANLIKTHKAADEDYEDYESSLDEQQANGNVPAHPEVNKLQFACFSYLSPLRFSFDHLTLGWDVSPKMG